MKKYLLCLLAFVSVFAISNAQQSARPTKDSLSSTDTAYAYVSVSGYYNTVGIQPVYTKKSGSVAGKIYIDGSIDGSNYKTIDTLTLSDASPNIFGINPNSNVFIYTGPPYTKYKVRYVNSGGAGYIKLYYILRK